jgi:hypothetical protein
MFHGFTQYLQINTVITSQPFILSNSLFRTRPTNSRYTSGATDSDVKQTINKNGSTYSQPAPAGKMLLA